MKIIAFNIKGMHCPSCEVLIKDILEEAGVARTEVNHKTGKISVAFEENKITLEDIKKLIQNLTFAADI